MKQYKYDCQFLQEFLEVLNITVFFVSLSWMMFMRASSVHKCSEEKDGTIISVRDVCYDKNYEVALPEAQHWKTFQL